MKFSNKSEFEAATLEQWTLLWDTVQSSEPRISTVKLKQVLAHLYGWHLLMLEWYRVGLLEQPDGSSKPAIPAKGFNWRQTPALNATIDDKYRKLPLANVKRRLKLSHGRVMKVVSELSDKQFSQAGQFAWTGKHAIASYIVPNTVSHYRWAIKKIKKLQR